MPRKKKSFRLPTIVLTKDDVERAIRNTGSNMMAARYLGINKDTWKKWATKYFDDNGISYYDKHCNKKGEGLKKFRKKDSSKVLADALNGKIPIWWISSKDIKERLISEGYFKEECDRCGFCERRNMDLKVPLILFYMDLNKKNLKLENLKFLCYNCYFISVGDVFEKRQIQAMEEHDVTKSKYLDWELPVSTNKEYDRIMTLDSEDSKYNSDKIENYIQNEEPEVKKEDDDFVEDEDKKDDDFGLDLVSYMKR